MTATDESWRGVAAEDVDELPGRAGIMLRDRSRRLLGELVRPYRKDLRVAIALVLAQNAATMAGPWLVGLGIDRGIPPLADGNWTPLRAVIGRASCRERV